MKASDEWWNSDSTEEQNNHDVNLTKPPKHFVEENNQDSTTLNSRSKEIVFIILEVKKLFSVVLCF